ncbi:11274_t:CDS:2 [Dentiscutata erythropus]|uniref:11274_t:CDS:1 n=1 Tax=Dentiscutata erythropus TaxID=1348616 RepID=A0A9N9GSF5_9GLOM|nr:11274_t:CDS:2 [Dentiscutata erythropus]
MSSTGSNLSGSTAHNRGKDSSYNNSSQVCLSRVVANSNAYTCRLCSFAPSSNHFHKRLFRSSKALEKPKLAVPGSKSELELFKKYCKIMSLISLPSEVDTLVSFIVWLDLTYLFAVCADILAAVSRSHLEAQLPDPSKEYWVRRVYKEI